MPLSFGSSFLHLHLLIWLMLLSIELTNEFNFSPQRIKQKPLILNVVALGSMFYLTQMPHDCRGIKSKSARKRDRSAWK